MTSTLTKTVKESKQEASYPTTMQTYNFTLLFMYKHNRTSNESNYHKMSIYVKYTLCYSECNWYTQKCRTAGKPGMNPKEPRPSIWSNMTDICHNVRSLWFQLLPQNWCIIDLMQTHHQSHLTFLAISNFDRHCTEESLYMLGFFIKPYGFFWIVPISQLIPMVISFNFSWLFMAIPILR